jgi:hypothetical protein
MNTVGLLTDNVAPSRTSRQFLRNTVAPEPPSLKTRPPLLMAQSAVVNPLQS